MKTKQDLNLAHFIQELKKRGVNFSALEKKAQLRRGTLSAWSAGHKPRDFHGLRNLALTLGVSLEALLYGTEETLKPVSPAIGTEKVFYELLDGTFEVELKIRRVIKGSKKDKPILGDE